MICNKKSATVSMEIKLSAGKGVELNQEKLYWIGCRK